MIAPVFRVHLDQFQVKVNGLLVLLGVHGLRSPSLQPYNRNLAIQLLQALAELIHLATLFNRPKGPKHLQEF